ncbi:serine hydrolase [Georgenia phoenicis]|uniref:serine hydrolase n=1 Tax=unclassified Georgenia TaxID=2626815 RepID=UPI0039AED474
MRRLLAVSATIGVAIAGAVLPAAADDRVGWDRSEAPQRVLRDGTPEEVGLVAAELERVEPALREGLTRQPTPFYPGAVSLIASQGVVVERTAVGHAVRWADTTTELPAEEQVEMRTDTIFDLASLSKLFTAVAVMQLVEDGEVALEDTAASYVPAFAANGKEDITVQQLLTHTAGLPAWINLWSAPDEAAALQRVWDVTPVNEPGTGYLYSDLGLITLGEIVERVSGLGLDEYVAEHITGPLGMGDTMYNPPAELLPRIAATEYQATPARGLVHGEVHDEAAWRLGGVAGHAGVFSTADDVAVFGQMLLNGGSYDGARVLEPATVEQMMRDYTGQLSSSHRGLGPELEAWFYHDVLTSAESAGHTGFTGTSLVIDPHTETIAILMTNRVHPSRDWGSINPVRRAVARAAGLAHPMTGFTRGAAWYSGIGDAVEHTLTVPVTLDSATELVVDLWFHTEPTDLLHVEASDDDGATWEPLSGTLTAGDDTVTTSGTVSGDGLGRWWEGRFDLAGLSGDVELRLRYATDAVYSGRGVYLDRIQVPGAFDDWDLTDRATITAEGWTRVTADGFPAPEPVEEWRGYWVDAFNPGIYDAQQVTALVEDAQEVGANALIVQVGRRFDCFCNDALLPRTDAAIAPAPYDPLAEVIEQAHAVGIEVHAWVNATTLWNSATPPRSPEHAFNQHGPSAEGRDRWLNKRVDGVEQVGNNTWIDPAHPDAVDYLVDAVGSIVENYDVDGVNLDYIRYPDHSTVETRNEWGYSETSLARFAAQTGRTDVPAPDDEQFSDWRRDQVSGLVRKVYARMFELDPQARLSVDGITYGFGPQSTPGGWEGTRTYANVGQDWRSWLDEGIVDTVTAMNYKRNWNPDQARMFAEWTEALVEYRGDRHVVNGPALYLNEVADSVAQARLTRESGADGWSGYSYANPSLTANSTPDRAVKDAEREALAAALRTEVFTEEAAVPEMEWRTSPTTGLLTGTLVSGADGATVTVTGPEGTTTARTDGSGWFAVVDLAPGTYTVSADGAEPAQARVTAGEATDVVLERAAPTDPAEALALLVTSVDEYVASGDVAGPLAHQLTTALHQAQVHLEVGREGTTVRMLERVLRHLDGPRRPDTLTAEARADLRAQTVHALGLLGAVPSAIAGAV